MTVVDYLVLAPLIPFLPIIATWWLPWEQWFPMAKYSHIFGPAMLYGAFVAWYFEAEWWAVLVFVFFGLAVLAVAVWAFLYKPSIQQPENEP